MRTTYNDTVVDKAVNLVKDAFGIRHHPDSGVESESGVWLTEPEVTAEQARSLDPNAFVVSPSGQAATGGSPIAAGETDAERLRREVDEAPRLKSLSERNDEMVRRENGV